MLLEGRMGFETGMCYFCSNAGMSSHFISSRSMSMGFFNDL